MSDYVQNPDNSKKQVIGKLPDNAYDRFASPTAISMSKTPNYVVINRGLTNEVGFFLNESKSFASLDFGISGGVTASKDKIGITGSANQTTFTSDFVAGDRIKITSGSGETAVTQVLTVDSVQSDTRLKLTSNWTGNTYTASGFVINNGKRKSSNYVKVGIPDTGSQLNIHPIAYSSSIADKNKITYIYRSGLGMEERI